MTKNVTISLPDELADAMAKLPEVNWSAVARDAVENYVKMREKPDLAEVVQLLIKQRGSDYARGVQTAQTLAKRKGNSWLDVIVREYNSIWWKEAEEAVKEQPDEYNVINDVTFTDEFEGQLMLQAWKKHDSTAGDESDGFMMGFKRTILDIHEMVRK
jgi:hypothetical protein